MVTRELESTPRILPLYARTVAPLLPGASRLPWVGGSAGEIPDLALSLMRVRTDPARLGEYCRVCALTPAEELPATYPHVLAFPLHLALMADGDFPFPAVGLVHVANRIAQLRPIRLGERLDLRVHATRLRPHRRGRVFSLVTEARVAEEVVWRELATLLHRETGAGGQAVGEAPASEHGSPGARLETRAAETSTEWRLPGELGRRYAAVSNDRNPIHLHPLSARALGFPRAIAHGMWTKARCLAALEAGGSVRPALAGAFSLEVAFRRPILLPARVTFVSAATDGAARFAVRDAPGGVGHLDGRLEPIEEIMPEQEEGR
jgi:acyl dehydratase